MDIRHKIRTFRPERMIVFLASAFFAFASLCLSVGLALKMPTVPGFGVFVFSYGVACLLGSCSMLFICSSIVRTNHFPQFTLPHLLQSTSTVILLALQSLLAFQPMKIESIFPFCAIAIFIWTVATMNLLSAAMNRRAESLIHGGVSAVAIIFCFVALQSLGFLGLEESFLSGWRNLTLLLLFHPAYVSIHAFLQEGQKRDSFGLTTLQVTIKQQFSEVDRTLYGSHLLALALQCAVLSYILEWLPPAASTQNWLGSRAIWVGLSFSLIPCSIWSFLLWRDTGNLRGQGIGDRQKSVGDGNSWVGLKTAVLLIEHDPHEECRIHLPALLYRARQLQCEQLIQKTFEQQILSQSSTGSQILLALDPRRNPTPCVQSLLILTVLYLDGLSTVESRLKNLVRLFPLLDPEMAHSLNAIQLESLFSRLQGFFHLDYSWIDQSRDESNSQLDIRLEHLNPRQRQRVLAQLSNSQWLGNFIWVSDAAREQIKIESPYLANAIERLPIRIEQTQGKILETAIFLVKFENLIPRLQRYYALDDIRTRLAPLPIATLTLGLLQGFEEELSHAISADVIENILSEIWTHDWVGFQAKDRALDLVLRCIDTAESLEKRRRVSSEDIISLRLKARDAVQKVGYPSQDFHLNHLHKLEIRQIHELKRICVDTRHPRFEEAWLLVSSLPSRFMDPETVMQLLTLVRSACSSSDLKHRPFVLQKALEGFFALARFIPEKLDNEMEAVLNLLARTLVEAAVNESLALSFLDRKLALDQTRGLSMPLQDEVIKEWAKLIQELLSRPNISSSMRQAIELRWMSFQSPARTQDIAS